MPKSDNDSHGQMIDKVNEGLYLLLLEKWDLYFTD